MNDTNLCPAMTNLPEYLAGRKAGLRYAPPDQGRPREYAEGYRRGRFLMDRCLVIAMPYSEVCMHMGIAGKGMLVEPLDNGMAQLYDPDTGAAFSAPITKGEAGILPDLVA